MSQNSKTWRVAPGGALLGTQTIISPWTGSPTEAVVNLDTNEVIAAHGATCHPFALSVPDSVFKGELLDALPALPPPAMNVIGIDPAREDGDTTVGCIVKDGKISRILDQDELNTVLYGDGPSPEMGLITLLTEEERAQIAEDVLCCNVCDEPLPHDRCDPAKAGDGHIKGLYAARFNEPPHALTDAHVAELERAIRAESYNILADPETGAVKLEKVPMAGWDDIPENPWPKIERQIKALTGILEIAEEGEASNDATAWPAISKLCKEGLGK
jgi:hypothetical protein